MTGSAHCWIALLRGVNVGGRNRVAMAELRQALAEDGFDAVRTLIQSGNVVLGSAERRADAVADSIARTVERRFGFRPGVMALTPAELQAILADGPDGVPCPADPATDGRALHFWIASEPPTAPDLDSLRRLASPSETVMLKGRVLYLHAPDGIGRSKLVPGIERHVAPAMTGRNLNTMRKLLALAGAG